MSRRRALKAPKAFTAGYSAMARTAVHSQTAHMASNPKYVSWVLPHTATAAR